MITLKRSTFLKNAVLGLSTTLVLVACDPATPPADEADAPAEETAETTEGGTWTVGTEPAFPPFESTENGEIVGFDIDLMSAIAEQAGYEVQFESLPFDGLIPSLQAGTIDAAISGMTITAERAETVDFSRPYFRAGLAIAVAEDNTDIQSLDDLEGRTIAVQLGTTGAEQAESIEGATVVTFDSAPLALQELANGNADAVINDAPVTLDAIASGNISGIKVVGELVTEEFYGIALPKDSENTEAVNEALSALIEDGTYAEIYEKWFGVAPEGELPESAL